MKNLTQYILESQKTYEFKIKIAELDVDGELLDRIEHALSAYGVTSVSKPKHLPISAKNFDFPSHPNCGVSIINAVLSYPCTDEQIRSVLGTQGRIPLAYVVVTPANSPEQLMRDEEDETDKNNNGASDDGVPGGQKLVGQQRADSMLKELETRKYEMSADSESSPNTTNDLPQNNMSPISGRKGRK